MAEREGLDATAIARTVAETMYRKDVGSQSIGITLKEIRPGHAVMTLRVTDMMLNSHGICHGGYIFALADSTFAYASNSYNQNTVASAGQIDFIRPARRDDLLIATAKEISRSGRIGLYDVTVTNQSGETIAAFRGTSQKIRGQILPGLCTAEGDESEI